MRLDTVNEAIHWVATGHKHGGGQHQVPVEESDVPREHEIDYDEDGIPVGIDKQIFQF